MHIKLLVNNPVAGFVAGTQNPNYRIEITKEYIDPAEEEPVIAWFIIARDLTPFNVRTREDIRLSHNYPTKAHALKAWEEGFDPMKADLPRPLRLAQRALIGHLRAAGLCRNI